VTVKVERGRPIVFSYVPALDGLRAVAVLGVMMYHGGAPVASGGFLAIDVFFVLSGFLITSLLLGEWARRLSVRLGQFWARRARRLLPALLVMLVGVAIYAKVFATPGEFANLRLDSLSTLFYVANWHFIVAGTSYFSLTAQPSPLQHMWSLSIEEQFYIIWPPVVLGMLHLGRKLRPERRLFPVLAVAVIGAIVSAVDMRWSYEHRSCACMKVPTHAPKTSSLVPPWPSGWPFGLNGESPSSNLTRQRVVWPASSVLIPLPARPAPSHPTRTAETAIAVAAPVRCPSGPGRSNRPEPA
jgi:hypothetical protein